MIRSVSLLPKALADAVHARNWYTTQREGLGDEFEATLAASLSAIAQFPAMYPEVTSGIRRCLLGHFPYGVFYRIESESLILVVAIFHASRDPAVLEERF